MTWFEMSQNSDLKISLMKERIQNTIGNSTNLRESAWRKISVKILLWIFPVKIQFWMRPSVNYAEHFKPSITQHFYIFGKGATASKIKHYPRFHILKSPEIPVTTEKRVGLHFFSKNLSIYSSY